MTTDIRIHCLGDFAAHGLSREIRGRKQVGLLVYLAANLGASCSREKLVTIFWGDRFDSQAKQSLRQGISALRKAFENCPEALVVDRKTVRLNPAYVQVDLADAEIAIANNRLELAADIFRRGSFLETMASNETGISEWLSTERAKWAELTRQAVLGRAQELYDSESPVAADEMAGWQLRQDPCDETAVRMTMRARAAAGSVSGAAALFKKFERTLEGELGIKPARETIDCYRDLISANDGIRDKITMPPETDDHRPRVIVLPFTDVHSGLDESLIADSLTDEVISALGRFSELLVTGRNTSIVYRESPCDPPTLVRELGIRYVVSGTVRKLGDKLRISIEVDDAVAQRFVSSERRDCSVAEFYDVQDDLACAIAGAIEPAIRTDVAHEYAKRPIDSLGLWEKALVARSHLDRGTKEDLFAAETVASEILKSDPNQLLALKVLAIAQYALVWNLWPKDLVATAEAALVTSDIVLRQDPFDADTLSIAARSYLTSKQYDRAIELAESSVRINPSNAQSHIHLGACYSNVGRFDEAFTHFAEARRISPQDRLIAFWDCAESYAYYGQGSFDKAIQISSASEKKPGTWAWTRIIFAILLVKTDQLLDAQQQVKKLLSDYPGLTCTRIEPLLMPQFERDMINCLCTAGLPR